MDFSKGAGIMCTNKKVWEYINFMHGEMVCKSKADAAEFMRAELEIQSRRELNTNEQAADRYIKFIREFNLWLNQK